MLEISAEKVASGRITLGEVPATDLATIASKRFVAGGTYILVGALVISVVVYTVGTVVFDIDPSVLPEWALSMASGVEG